MRVCLSAVLHISIHVPRVGDDSTVCVLGGKVGFISIHVPRVGDDTVPALSLLSVAYFNPRPPCGGRLKTSPMFPSSCLFQSTSPVWGTTKYIYSNCCCNRYFNPRPPCGGRQILDVDIHNSIFISFHVPRVGDDALAIYLLVLLDTFQSTSPAWGTTYGKNKSFGGEEQFQSTSPAWGTTTTGSSPALTTEISIHVPRVGDDVPIRITTFH